MLEARICALASYLEQPKFVHTCAQSYRHPISSGAGVIELCNRLERRKPLKITLVPRDQRPRFVTVMPGGIIRLKADRMINSKFQPWLGNFEFLFGGSVLREDANESRFCALLVRWPMHFEVDGACGARFDAFGASLDESAEAGRATRDGEVRFGVVENLWLLA